MQELSARDSLAPADGFDPAASESMPFTDDAAMPYGDEDAASPDDDLDLSAASEGDEEVVEDAPDIETQLNEARETLRAELKAEFDADKARLQSIHNRQLLEAKNRAQELDAKMAVFRQWVEDVFDQYGVDKRELDVIENKLGKAEKLVQQRRVEIQQRHAQVRASLEQAHNAKLAQASVDEDGTVLFDRNDPEIAAQFNRAMAVVNQHYELEGGAEGTRLYHLANSEFERLKQLIARKQVAGARGIQAAKKAEAAQKQAATRAKAKARGPQSTARGTGGGGPVSFKDYKARAAAEMPGANEIDIYVRAKVLQMEAEGAAV